MVPSIRTYLWMICVHGRRLCLGNRWCWHYQNKYDGTILTNREVRHVDGLKKNLFSLEQFDSNGCKTHVKNGIMKTIKDVHVVKKAEKIATNLYMLTGETLKKAKASVASANYREESMMMWQNKLGHISKRGLKILFEHNVLSSLKKVSLPFCEHRMTSRQHRLKFSTSSSRRKNITELIHSNVWQAEVTSLVGARYFVSFINNSSKRCWVYPIKKKSIFSLQDIQSVGRT